MNHGTDSDFLAFDAIDHDKISVSDEQFSGPLSSWPSKMREVIQPLNCGDETSNHTVRRFGTIEGDVMPNLANLTPCFRRPDYPH
jgi:hypothetical protein